MWDGAIYRNKRAKLVPVNRKPPNFFRSTVNLANISESYLSALELVRSNGRLAPSKKNIRRSVLFVPVNLYLRSFSGDYNMFPPRIEKPGNAR
jgi:hypothetical protein